MDRVFSKKNPIVSGSDPDYPAAYSLIAKNVLEATGAPTGKPKFRPTQPDWVWLPNAIVDGFGQADSPLARLRQIRDARAVLLLLDCYRHANLAEDGGLPWAMVRRTYKRQEVYRHGHFTVWGFVTVGQAAEWDPLFSRFKGKDMDKASKELWSVFNALEAAGLIEGVGHIVESLSPGSQVLHAYALPKEGEEEERQVALAAHRAGLAIVPTRSYASAQEALGSPPWLCPIRSHVTDAQLVGIYRVIHRPHTRRTSAWARNFLHRCETDTALFEALGQKVEASVA